MGIILFAMIAGYLPFEANSIPALYRKIKQRNFKYPEYMTKGEWRVIFTAEVYMHHHNSHGAIIAC